ncbi:MAG: right-handed parallel beta-helix repeat-containing protein [Candidatus Schekmanbacteria bacterium]|nr:right-handed parallel beta-helix repeat-containing protein [Candidatus Schekmanbacteria bacterium]
MDKRHKVQKAFLAGFMLILLLNGCGKASHEAEEPKKAVKKSKIDLVRRTKLSKEKESGGTIIGGEVKENTVLQLVKSPYIVNRDLTILPDIKLTIEPGVVVRVAPYTSIVVRGNFQAIGAKDKKIKFVASNEEELWDGLRFMDESFDYNSDELIEGNGCIVENCQFEKAKTAIICDKSSPVIRNNVFKNNEEAVKCRNHSMGALIANNIIEDNNIGITCEEYSNPEIIHNTIIGAEGRGVSCTIYSSPNVTYNIIFGKGESWWKGIICQDNSAPKITHNNIYSNGGYNFYYVKMKPGEGTPEIDAQNNWWGLSDKEEIAKRINDKGDKGDLGEVKFEPFLNSKVGNAGHEA